MALAFVGALEGAVIELAGQAPYDELLAARAAAGALGLDGVPAPAREAEARAMRLPEQRAHLPARGGSTSSPPTSGSRTCGRCRRRAARTTFGRLVQAIASGDPSQGSSSRALRALFAIRWKVGELLGWDDPDAGLGSRVPTLRDRLPADLRDAPSGPHFGALPFTSLYLLDDEWAAEIANRTMHGVMHVGWVADGTGGYRGQMAVLREAERTARERLHGRDQAVPAPDRVPADDAADRAELEWRG